jgi:hypothetical protein
MVSDVMRALWQKPRSDWSEHEVVSAGLQFMLHNRLGMRANEPGLLRLCDLHITDMPSSPAGAKPIKRMTTVVRGSKDQGRKARHCIDVRKRQPSYDCKWYWTARQLLLMDQQMQLEGTSLVKVVTAPPLIRPAVGKQPEKPLEHTHRLALTFGKGLFSEGSMVHSVDDEVRQRLHRTMQRQAGIEHPRVLTACRSGFAIQGLQAGVSKDMIKAYMRHSLKEALDRYTSKGVCFIDSNFPMLLADYPLGLHGAPIINAADPSGAVGYGGRAEVDAATVRQLLPELNGIAEMYLFCGAEAALATVQRDEPHRVALIAFLQLLIELRHVLLQDNIWFLEDPKTAPIQALHMVPLLECSRFKELYLGPYRSMVRDAQAKADTAYARVTTNTAVAQEQNQMRQQQREQETERRMQQMEERVLAAIRQMQTVSAAAGGSTGNPVTAEEVLRSCGRDVVAGRFGELTAEAVEGNDAVAAVADHVTGVRAAAVIALQQQQPNPNPQPLLPSNGLSMPGGSLPIPLTLQTAYDTWSKGLGKQSPLRQYFHTIIAKGGRSINIHLNSDVRWMIIDKDDEQFRKVKALLLAIDHQVAFLQAKSYRGKQKEEQIVEWVLEFITHWSHVDAPGMTFPRLHRLFNAVYTQPAHGTFSIRPKLSMSEYQQRYEQAFAARFGRMVAGKLVGFTDYKIGFLKK